MFYWIIPIVLWAAYFWLKQFRLRQKHKYFAIRSAKEIWQHALDERGQSLLLFMPVASALIVTLAYLKGGWGSALIATPGASIYAALVVVSERYPLAKYA